MKRLFVLLVALVASFSMVAENTIVESPATDAVYRLPMERGVAVVARALTPVNLGVSMSLNQIDFCAWELSATRTSEVVAPREGVVESVVGDEVVILHPDGLYTKLMLVEGVSVSVGDRLEKGDKVGLASASSNGSWRVWMATYYLESNPNYGTPARNGKYEHLVKYINPIFTTKSKCKVMLLDGGAYTVKARTWCWFWE
ncbi:MAG: M23 family metallopeptidase [Tidjanibacter sp.]|nr:M23 family metallopeptidase [Tidjanibacter sp.]